MAASVPSCVCNNNKFTAKDSLNSHSKIEAIVFNKAKSPAAYPFRLGRLLRRLLRRFSIPIMSCTDESSGGRRRLAGTAATFAGSPNPKPPAELMVPVSECGNFFFLPPEVASAAATVPVAAEDEDAWPAENFRHILSISSVYSFFLTFAL